ncbi:hypothetical protein JL39_00305 [Rhizobium sp. YS-1r]|nr:hypothetical protein JL39_00305 [Rhizobium sp. YS-1r]
MPALCEQALLTSRLGSARIRIEDGRLLIELRCLSEQALQMSRTSIAEHLFYFSVRILSC